MGSHGAPAESLLPRLRKQTLPQMAKEPRRGSPGPQGGFAAAESPLIGPEEDTCPRTLEELKLERKWPQYIIRKNLKSKRQQENHEASETANV